jgi:uncharacterized membrane protein YphA (DoxX/SURF4 family)
VWRVYLHNYPRLGQWAAQFKRQPRWLIWTAGSAAAALIVVPILALFVAAVLVGLGVFLVLGIVATILALPLRLWRLITGPRGDDGRRNVRVVRSDRTLGQW